jgi:transcription elongation factor Elf1
MMTNAEIIYQGVKFGMTAAASKGAKIIVDEFVSQFTPENLDNTKKMCVEIAKWGGAAAFGSLCANAVEAKLEKGKSSVKAVKKFVDMVREGKNIQVNINDAKPVIDADDDNGPVEIDDEDEIPVVDLD